MANCLITKLKDSVNNPNLPYFGAVEFSIEKNPYLNIYGDIKVNPGQTATLISKTDGTTISISDVQTVNIGDLVQHGYNWIFVSAYNAFPCSINNGYTEVGCRGIIFNIEDWSKVSPTCLTEITLCNNRTITGSLNALPSSSQLKTINIMNTNISGDYANLVSKYPNLGKNGGLLNLYSNDAFDSDVAGLAGLHYMPSTLWLSRTSTGDFYNAIVGWRQNIGETGSTPTIIGATNAKLWSITTANTFTISWTATTSSITMDSATTTFDNNGNII